MNKPEFIDFMGEMAEIWPRMNVTERMSEYWWSKVGSRYSRQDCKQILSEYVEAEDKVPTIAAILGRLRARFRNNRIEDDKPFYLPPAYPALEWLMDVLGVETVCREMKSIVGENPSWSGLVSQRNWVPKYKAKMAELYKLAREYSSIEDEDYNKMMANHEAGIQPPVVWKNDGIRRAMFARWNSRKGVEA